MKEAVSLKLTASFLNMAPPAGLEPATYGLTRGGIEPPTRGFSIPCSTA